MSDPVERRMDLRAMNEVRKLQQNSELGAFCIHAALKQLGIRLSTRTCGRLLARNRKLCGLRGPEAKPREPEPMLFKTSHRHQYWTVDVRYLDRQLGDGNSYNIRIIENYSRFILGSLVSGTQDLRAFPHVLLSAVAEYGAPEVLVSDGGSVFGATRAMAIYRALGIEKEQIARRQPWQSYIETAFNVQRRMADWDFAKAESWREFQELRAGWLHDYNPQEQWAHRKRQDGRRSPREILGWIKGRAFGEEELAGLFAPLLFRRRIEQQGYVRFRNWRLYGERGLSGRQAVDWVTEEELTVQFAEEPLAQYVVKHRRDRRHFRRVASTRLFERRYRSPQLPLRDGAAEPRRLAIELPERRRRRRSPRTMTQAALFPPADGVGAS